jgi:hypothetical protein
MNGKPVPPQVGKRAIIVGIEKSRLRLRADCTCAQDFAD